LIVAFNFFKAEMATGMIVGVTTAALIPLVLPAVAIAARPLARAVIKNGIIAYEKSQEWIAEAGEFLDDLVAEARAELEQEGYFQGEVYETAAQGAAAGATAAERAPARGKAAGKQPAAAEGGAEKRHPGPSKG
jgi:hypothetical protein